MSEKNIFKIERSHLQTGTISKIIRKVENRPTNSQATWTVYKRNRLLIMSNESVIYEDAEESSLGGGA